MMLAFLIIFLVTVRLNIYIKKTGSTGDDSAKAVKIIISLKYLSNFWRTLEMLLINCGINLILTWSKNVIISNAAENQDTKFAKADKKLYVPVVI